MTYFGFLLRFLVIPIFIFGGFYIWDQRKSGSTAEFGNGRIFWLVIGVHILLALIYTTPWDNYLVATRVWFYNPKLVTGIVLGYVPIEEYTFFILEVILVGLWWNFLAGRTEPAPTFRPIPRLRHWSLGVVTLVWAISTILLFFGSRQLTYLTIILFWALLPTIPQFIFGADLLWHYRRLILATIIPAAVYLSLTDSIAIASSTWTIDPAQSTNLFIGTLPIEEALFFVMTAMLLTFGMTLALAKESRGRFRGLLESR